MATLQDRVVAVRSMVIRWLHELSGADREFADQSQVGEWPPASGSSGGSGGRNACGLASKNEPNIKPLTKFPLTTNPFVHQSNHFPCSRKLNEWSPAPRWQIKRFKAI